MKTVKTDGISYIEQIPGAQNDWYYGIDYEHGDLYEAEELFKEGHEIKGRKLRLVHYPDGAVYSPVPEKKGCYSEKPVFYENGIYILNVDFRNSLIQIFRFDCKVHETLLHAEIPLSAVKDCYNLCLQISPVTLTRQSTADNEFEIVWPEKAAFKIDDHDSFFLRDKDKLFFNRWHEEGEGADYKYFEETIVRDLNGTVSETLPGDVMLMPGGELWHLI